VNTTPLSDNSIAGAFAELQVEGIYGKKHKSRLLDISTDFFQNALSNQKGEFLSK